ncbi:hypothetical protein [Allohahella sp. A8]|uniref:hypothetical protein n=1 Tax=Allohahella sp. A8 TaxID=3141461 RepID=UPI003A80CDFB
MAHMLYQLRTDRRVQWELLEERMKKAGATRANLHKCRKLFFDNDSNGRFRWVDRFWFYFNPTFDGWQHLFDHELNEKLSDQDFRDLNRFLCGQLADYFFSTEDQQYYFDETFGAAFDANRKFSLRINGEEEARKVCLSADGIFQRLVLDLSTWLREGPSTSNYRGILAGRLPYLESLLSHIDPVVFSVCDELPIETRDGITRAKITRGSIKNIFERAVESTDNASFDAMPLAKAVTELLMAHAKDLGDMALLYQGAKSQAGRA